MTLPVPLPFVASTSSFALLSKSAAVALTSTAFLPAATTTTQLALSATHDSPSQKTKLMDLAPRPRSAVFMAVAMALHFGGYEFIRNSCLSLFTSTDYGFTSPAAFPLCNALVSPFSILLLWGYGQQLEAAGPRGALYRTTAASIAFIGLSAASQWACRYWELPRILSQALIAVTFLFQNSYQYLLYTQHWSYLSSVLTPDEGARWFTVITGSSTLLCSAMGQLVPFILPHTGLLGLLASTMITLTGTLLFSDAAYGLAQKHGFDPSEQKKKESKEHTKTEKKGRVGEALSLFRRNPTMAALFTETISFQTLNTILNVAFVTALKAQIPDDLARSAYTSRIYSLINGLSATLQFVVLPTLVKRLEPSLLWRLMPVFPLLACGSLCFRDVADLNLSVLTAAYCTGKILDYSLRGVIYVMAYQHQDYESRYVGKEIVGVFGSRFGKSGMSLILSALTMVGWTGLPQLLQYSLGSSVAWLSSTWWLSSLLPTKAEAQAMVEARQKGDEKKKKEN